MDAQEANIIKKLLADANPTQTFDVFTDKRTHKCAVRCNVGAPEEFVLHYGWQYLAMCMETQSRLIVNTVLQNVAAMLGAKQMQGDGLVAAASVPKGLHIPGRN